MNFLIFLLCLATICSTTRIEQDANGNLKNILVVISDDVVEDFDLVKKIKDAFQTGSNIFRAASAEVGGFRKSFGFSSVHILIPNHWQSENVNKSSWEREDIRDYHVTLTGLENDGRPRAIQPFGCGLPAMYTVMSAQYLRSTSTQTMATEVVHEFAHLRYGVFDEYNRNGPYYYFIEKKIVPIRCSPSITGNFFNKTSGLPGCWLNKTSNVPGPDCIFIPNTVQDIANSSIMYATFIGQVQHFCSARHPGVSFDHDKLAPNPQNNHCHGTSVQEVMSRHNDFRNSPQLNGTSPDPVVNFVVVRKPDHRRIVLIFDVSGSMSGSRIRKLKIAAIHLINQFPKGTMVGIVTFANRATILMALTPLENEYIRQDFRDIINSINVQGETSIGSGLLEAMKISGVDLNNPSADKDGYFMLFSDGEDNYDTHKYAQAVNILQKTSLVLDAVSISNSADSRLSDIAKHTGGKDIFISDSSPDNQIQPLIEELLKGRFPFQSSAVSKTFDVPFNVKLQASVNVDSINNIGSDTVIIVIAFFLDGANFVIIPDAVLKGQIYADSTIPNVPLLSLRDDGNGADNEAGDGIYSAYILPEYVKQPQKYSVKVDSTKPAGLTAYTNKFDVIGSPKPGPLLQPPARVSNLKAEMNMIDLTVKLLWGAVGDQQDIGTANRYEIRISENFTQLRDDFLSTTVMPVNPRPLPSGQEMSVILNSSQISIRNTTFHLAVVAYGSTNLRSQVSNIVAGLLIEPENPEEFNITTPSMPTTTTIQDTTTEETTIELTTEIETTTQPTTTQSTTTKSTTTTEPPTTTEPTTTTPPTTTEATTTPSTTTTMSTTTTTPSTTTTTTQSTTTMTTPPTTTELTTTPPTTTTERTTTTIPSTTTTTQSTTTPSTTTTTQSTTTTSTTSTTVQPTITQPPIGPNPEALSDGPKAQTAVLITTTVVFGCIVLACVAYIIWTQKMKNGLIATVTPSASADTTV